MSVGRPAPRVIVAILVAILAAGCSSDGSRRNADKSPRPTTASPEAGSPQPDGEPGEGRQGDSGSTAPAPQRIDEPAQPAAVAEPIPDGTYRYRVVSIPTEEEESEEEVGRIEVRPSDVEEVSGERTQTILWDGWEYGRQRRHIAWRDDGRYEVLVVFERDEETQRCDWNPDFRTLAFPLAEDSSWTADSTCTTASGATTATTNRSDRVRVSGKARVEVDGTTVDVWVLERFRREALPQFGVIIERSLTELYAPSLGLSVETTIDERTTMPSRQTRRKHRLELIDIPDTI